MTPFFESAFDFNIATPDLGIIALEGAKELGEKIDRYLVNWYNTEAKAAGKNSNKSTFLIESECPRFNTGDGKGFIKETVRGRDLFLIVDVGNYNCTYKMFGKKVYMSPDDHFCDLKRIISAIAGKASSITVIMPLLYGGRQHRRNSRESLDCAMMLRELEDIGVKDIITFDAHDPRVQNATPLMGFDNFFPTYQILKALTRKFSDIEINTNNFMIVSPDEGAMIRNIYYASVLGLDLGMFYKRRDYSKIVNGRNPIAAHEYIGSSVMGMDVFVADDIIATGDSCLKLAENLKERGANRIFINATYSLFTEGVEKFQKAYEEGLFTAVISTNLSYRRPELKEMKWFLEADMSKFLAYIISACNQNRSVSELLDPHNKIRDLIDNFNMNKVK